jgi:GNAT superfamily N-acetyltransferase
VIRLATPADVPAILAHVAASLGEFGLAFGTGSATDEQLRGLPGSYAGGAFWVAEQGGALVGTCGVFPVTPATYELRKMYLRGDARGAGLGRALLAAAVAWCRERGAAAIVLDTTEQMARAIAFYEAQGFVRDDAQVRGARCSRGYRLDLR